MDLNLFEYVLLCMLTNIEIKKVSYVSFINSNIKFINKWKMPYKKYYLFYHFFEYNKNIKLSMEILI